MNTATAARKEHEITLDMLSTMSADELEQLYRCGGVPKHLDILNGDPVGRVLAIRALDKTPLSGMISLFAKSRAFPWEGKSFMAHSACTGTGINRFKVIRSGIFPFNTRVSPSRIDGGDCIQFDYDIPDNLSIVRRVYDEIREIEPGVFVGPAMWKFTHARVIPLVWFAIDTREHAPQR